MDEQTEPLGESYNYNQDYHKISDFLGVNIYDRSDSELAKKVSALQEWATAKTGKKDTQSALIEMSKLQKSLGVNFIGKPLVVEMYKHMRLHQDNVRTESIPKAPVKAKAKPMGKIEEAIQKVVKQTITEAMKGAMK